MPTILDNALFTAFSEASEQVYIYVCDVKQDLSHWSKNAVTFFGLPGEYMENAAELWMAKDVYKRQPSNRINLCARKASI